MFEDLTFFELLGKGGVTVYVLAVLSVLSIAVMLERAAAFRRFSSGVSALYQELSSAMSGGGVKAATGVCRARPSPLASVVLAGCEKSSGGKEAVASAMELAGRIELQRLERRLGVLGTIGSTAPFIGLFGTVLGIIRAFSDLSLSEGVSPAAVADGIAEALVATAAGLFVAVPAVIAYNYFVRAASREALRLETAATELASRIHPEG